MKVSVHQVTIHRDMVTRVTKDVWPWELPVLETKFPEGMVEVIGESSVERDSLPDPAAEYQRLRTMYGVEDDTKQAFCDIAFGRGRSAEEAIAKLMKGAIAPPKTEAAPKKVAAKKVSKKKATAKKPKPLSDPLSD